jgi:hypothetical protein
MKIEDIKQILVNKINSLVDSKGLAVQRGDLTVVEKIDAELAENEQTLNQLNS